MKRTVKSIVYNTETATVVKKLTYGAYGDPAGFETTLYRTPEGNYFLYTFGGAQSSYSKEAIAPFTEERAKAFMENN